MVQIKLRPQKLSDARRFLEILQNANFKYFPVSVRTLQDEINFLTKNIKQRQRKESFNFTILLGNEIVGACGLRIDQHKKFIGEIGYFVDEKYWGRGIATAAAKQLEKLGFQKLGLVRIEIRMDPRNKASEKVAIKAGYKSPGKPYRYHDDYVYAKVK